MEIIHLLGLLLVGALIADYIRIRKQNAKLGCYVTNLSEQVMKHYGLHYTYQLMTKEDNE